MLFKYVRLVLVGLASLDLQQSQYGRVIGQLHPALTGQADVLRQIIHSSCRGDRGRVSDHVIVPLTLY